MARLAGAMFEAELREWVPMNDLLTKIPAKILIGLFQHDVKLTCVDAIKEIIVLGTNLGIVYLYDRMKKNLQRLRSDTNLYTPISVIKIISSVDYMIASGAKDGKVTIYQIPKEHPDSIPDVLKPKNLQAERYIVADMHKDQITALEWSKNAMKLFSGDKQGSVILTEFDYQMHLSKSVEIINDTYEIVQLSYSQQILLVSTQYRSIVCQKCDKWIISQVGKKVRKTLGRFGGVFYQKGPRARDVVLFCTRPGLRLWESNLEGAVQNTLIFKDILTSDCPEIPLINPISCHLRSAKPKVEPTFGVLLPFSEDLLVTYSDDSIYVINPKELQVIGVVEHLRNILGVATNKDEIFILEGERMLLRISHRPESNNVPLLTTKTAVSKNLSDIANKIQTNSIISDIPAQLIAFDQQSDASSVVRAEEALESTLLSETKSKFDLYNQISTQDFDETILFKRVKRKKHSRSSLTSNQDNTNSLMTTSVCSTNSNSSDDRDIVINGASAMTVSTVSVLPDMRSAESIRNDIEEKERMLADILHFSDMKIDISRLGQETTTGRSFQGSALKVDEPVRKHKIIVVNGVKRSLPKDIVNVGKPEQLLDDSFDSSVEDISTQRIRLKSETDTLLCRNVPKDWDLTRVLINSEDSIQPASDANVSSLSDWEVL